MCDESIVPVSDLITLLKLKGIEYDLDDDGLNNLIGFKVKELMGLLGVDLVPVQREYMIQKFKSNKIFLNFYPVLSIENITIGKDEVEDYIVNKNIGVVYLEDICDGMLHVDYTTKLPDKDINVIIKPLLMDMVMYDLINKGNKINEGSVSTIKEGDVSVSYDTSSNLGNRIYTRIGDLRLKYSSYNTKVRLM